MKKILYLHAGAELYGADIVLLELLKNIDKKKFEPLVILPCEGPLVKKLKQNNIKVMVIEYPILRRKYFTPFGILNYIKDYFKYSKEIKEIVEKNNIDIIHTNTAAVLEGAYVKRKVKTIKHIWHIHEIIVKPPIIHKFLSFIISRFSDEVVVVSNAVKKHLMDTGYFKKEIKVIYNGVDNKIFNPNNDTEYIRKEFNIPKDSIVVGMIGRINAWKGQKDFLLAMDKVLKKNNNVYAMMVGGVFEGEEWRKKELEEQINTMENKDRIIFSDYRKDTPNIHCLYDIFVLPSTNPDPLPTVVLEAMASGKPVVGYRHGGVCEMVDKEKNGFLIDVNDTEQLANQIDYLIKHECVRKDMGNDSKRKQLNEFSLKSYTDNFEVIY
ncbi:glycosyltransferase family 1 protein [Clostridium butyricum]|uniref:glycosyltransferase family 4 protein n=1 Tax=Clostridium butyricum TaxID=1492 RepID=UPI000F53920B|nr:glycosyltransferase family 4 protein [Clostridium butyricum]RQN02444.1 glycosyltransferase family 1 protein [Clostridium butyricum]